MQSKRLMRIYNKNKILDLIRKNHSIYRAELARLTGLSMPTIMNITDELIDDGLIRDAGKGISSGGKPPMLLELIPESHLFAGVDISGAMFKCTILDLQGNIVFSRSREKEGLPLTEIIEAVEEFIDTSIGASGVDRDKLSGIGVGIPGLVDTEDGMVITSIDYNLKQVDFRTPLQRRFNMPVFIENSSKVMAIGEKWFGAGKQWNDGTNTLCIAPGVVVVYDRNNITNNILREHGIKVFEMPSAELSRGRGGPRCMSMPLIREDIYTESGAVKKENIPSVKHEEVKKVNNEKFNFKGRNFLTLLDYTPEEIRYLLDLSKDLKDKKHRGIEHRYLKGKNIVLLFEKTSTRTRCSFEVAGLDLGMGVTD